MTDQPSDPPTDSSDPREDAPTFEAPWQARAFALAVALTDEDDLPWKAFQTRLVEEVDASPSGEGDDPEGVYYRQWLAALERLLVERDLLDAGELTERVEAFERGDRDAHEFVEGDPHDHADRLPEGHADGSDHEHGHDHSYGHEHDHEH